MMGNAENKYPTQWAAAQPANDEELATALRNIQFLEHDFWGHTIAAPPLQRLRYLATAQEAGINMEMIPETRAGQEEMWTHRMVYLTAKAANFRATTPRFAEANPTAQAMRTQDRQNRWDQLKMQCDQWNACIPSTMHPAAYIMPHQHPGKSAFPEIW